jgi:hypothetical protein
VSEGRGHHGPGRPGRAAVSGNAGGRQGWVANRTRLPAIRKCRRPAPREWREARQGCGTNWRRLWRLVLSGSGGPGEWPEPRRVWVGMWAGLGAIEAAVGTEGATGLAATRTLRGAGNGDGDERDGWRRGALGGAERAATHVAGARTTAGGRKGRANEQTEAGLSRRDVQRPPSYQGWWRRSYGPRLRTLCSPPRNAKRPIDNGKPRE